MIIARVIRRGDADGVTAIRRAHDGVRVQQPLITQRILADGHDVERSRSAKRHGLALRLRGDDRRENFATTERCAHGDGIHPPALFGNGAVRAATPAELDVLIDGRRGQVDQHGAECGVCSRPCSASADRVSGGIAKCPVVTATRETPARCHDVCERTRTDLDLQNAAVEIQFEFVAMTETELS